MRGLTVQLTDSTPKGRCAMNWEMMIEEIESLLDSERVSIAPLELSVNGGSI